MFKRIAITAGVAGVAALLTHAWRADSLPGDPTESKIAPVRQGTVLDEPPAARAPDCWDDVGAGDARAMADACLLEAAEALSEAPRAEALRRAASLVRGEDEALADLLLMTAAARGDLEALTQYADMPDGSADDALLRREAALMAAQAGSKKAQAALAQRRAAYQGQALSRPEVLVALLEGRGLEMPDDLETRRYLLGILVGIQNSCPFQSAMWQAAGFSRAHELYAAPVVAAAHTHVASSATDALAQAATAIGRFAQQMDQGAGYVDAGAGLMRDLREAQRNYNNSVSRVSEAGARDGVRTVELVAGCSSADGTRLLRALMDVFSARARQAPAQR